MVRRKGAFDNLYQYAVIGMYLSLHLHDFGHVGRCVQVSEHVKGVGAGVHACMPGGDQRFMCSVPDYMDSIVCIVSSEYNNTI